MTFFQTEADRLSDAAHRDFDAGRLEEALAGCVAAMRADAAHIRAMNLAAVILIRQGRPAEAEALLKAALAQQPGRPDILRNLLVCLSDAGQWVAADRVGRQLAVLDPGLVVAWERLGAVAQKQGDVEAAARWTLRAARLAPTALIFSNLEQVALVAGEIALSLESARRHILLEPDSAGGPYFQGNALLTLGRLDEAARSMQRSALLDPAGDGPRGSARCDRYGAARAAAATAASASGVAIRGAFRPVSGYGHVTHRLIRTLRARQVPVQAIGLLGGEQWPDEPLDAPVPARACVQCVIPVAIERIPRLMTVAYTMFECPRIPPAWRRLSEAADLILVPTRSSFTAWADAGFPEDRLRLCPLGVDPAPALDGSGGLTLDSGGRAVADFRCRFLNVSDANARKNVDGLLRVWLRATRRDDDAVLILKLGKGEGGALPEWVRAIVGRAEADTGRRLADAAPILVLNQPLSEPEMDGLFRAATHYWSLSHGEGWDLPMTKAGTLGLGLIAPSHSSYLDYLDDSVARMIPSTVGPAIEPGTDAYYPPFHGLDWWVPDEAAAVEALVDVIRGGVVLPSARDRLLGQFTWNHAADRLLAILAEAGAMEPRVGHGH